MARTGPQPLGCSRARLHYFSYAMPSSDCPVWRDWTAAAALSSASRWRPGDAGEYWGEAQL